MEENPEHWVYADFNGLIAPDLLCISHSDTATDRSGRVVQLVEGMVVTAFDGDADDNGNPDDIFAMASSS